MAQQLPKLVTDTYTKEQIEAIDALFFSGNVSAHDREVCYCVAATLNLNPITGEVMFLPRRQKIKQGGGEKWIEKIEPLVGRDGYLAVANRIKTFNGMETSSEIREMPRLINGEWTTVKTLVAICKVHRKDAAYPFVAEVVYHEYLQTDKAGRPTRLWQEKPDLMLKKVAESQALRKAFNLHGTYCPEELGIGCTDAAGKLVPDRESQAFPQKSRMPDQVISTKMTVDDAGDKTIGQGIIRVSLEQAVMLESLIKEVDADMTKFLQYFGIGRIQNMPAARAGEAVGMLERKRQANAKKHRTTQLVPSFRAPDIVSTLNRRSITSKEEGGCLYATPQYGDATAITLLKGLGFKQQGSSWTLQIPA